MTKDESDALMAMPVKITIKRWHPPNSKRMYLVAEKTTTFGEQFDVIRSVLQEHHIKKWYSVNVRPLS